MHIHEHELTVNVFIQIVNFASLPKDGNITVWLSCVVAAVNGDA
jgi:hypothetical protein